MSRDFPDWVNPERAASARREFAGTMPLARMPRVEDLVETGGTNEIQFVLAFSLNEQGQVRVDVEIKGSVPMRCQRTLGTFEQPLESRSVIGVVASEDDVAGLPDDYEPVLCPDQRLELASLVEEEVLLSLPLVPVDPASSPVGQAAAVEEDTHRPFEGLAELRKKRET
ncbi:MAG: DNA-binding protein [Wenzhouxiangella sp.]|nr:MAG: DNA-binding protein [Wenzhouxiangella sp.]